jgi:hypothetical protein
MARKGKTGQWHANNVVMEAVSVLGWRVEVNDRETVIATDGIVRLRARLDADVLEFGVERDFDRWANSTDMVLGIKDYVPAKIEEAMRTASWLAKGGLSRRAGDDWVDLRDHLPRYREAVAAAA